MKLDLDFLNDVLKRAAAQGADSADALAVESKSASVRARMGDVEIVTTAVEKRLGLRVFKGKRQAINSTSDLDEASVAQLVADTCEMAAWTAEDPFSGLADAGSMAANLPELNLCDESAPQMTMEERIDIAKRADRASLDADPRISNTEGAEFSTTENHILYGSSAGFSGDYRTTVFNLGAAPIAKENGSMQVDYWMNMKRRRDEMMSPEALGKKAAERALRKLGARKAKTTEAPVIFEGPAADSLLSCIFSAVAGSSIYKGASWLIGRMGQKVAADTITIVDDALMPGQLGSKPFDADGLATRRNVVIEKGVLKTWLLDTYSARKLDMQSTGNAARGVSGGPFVSSTNFYLAPGEASLEEMIRSVKNGLLVTGLMGFGVNGVTGDYSQGCNGIWIENGELAYPVEEITIASNLRNMLLGVEVVGADLEWLGSTASPSIKVAKMAIAGE